MRAKYCIPVNETTGIVYQMLYVSCSDTYVCRQAVEKPFCWMRLLYDLFPTFEEAGILDTSNGLHMFSLYYDFHALHQPPVETLS